MPSKDHPVNLANADNILRNIYGPALREQIESSRDIFAKLGYTPTVIETIPPWKFFLITAKERLNASYMHLRYGACDEERAWNDHIC